MTNFNTFHIPDTQAPHPDYAPPCYTVAPFLSPPVVPTTDLMRVSHHRVIEGGQLVIKTTIDGVLLGTFEDYGPAEAAAVDALLRATRKPVRV